MRLERALKDKVVKQKNTYWANLRLATWRKRTYGIIFPQYKPYVLTAPAVNFDFPEELRYSREHK